jgi:hypothetical protein
MRRAAAAWLALGIALASSPALAAASETVRAVDLSGRALLLTEALKNAGISFDRGPVARQVVVVGDDGSVTPLLSDEASRALFEDARLRGRRIEVKGRLRSGLPYLQVVSFRVEDDGRLQTPEYYCEICTISVRYPQICPCCQGEMVLRMRAEPN